MSAKPTADVSVRVAWGDDAPGIAAVQVRAWRAAYADLLPADALDALDAAGRAAVPGLEEDGLLVREDAALVLTTRGRLLADAVVRALLP